MKIWGTSLVGKWLRLQAPDAEGLISITCQGTKTCMLKRSCMLQGRSCMLKLRPNVAKFFFLNEILV